MARENCWRTRLMRAMGGSGLLRDSVIRLGFVLCRLDGGDGSYGAGINHDYSILISKGVIDGVTSISFAAAMGVGVACSIVPLVLYQGILTLAFAAAGPGDGSGCGDRDECSGRYDYSGDWHQHAGAGAS